MSLSQAPLPFKHAHDTALSAVQVHYCGTLDDDSVFDSSHERDPLDFIVGSGKVIPGFDDVVIGMVKGERRKERVEADRAYGIPVATGAADHA